jgi:hypothetical protein
MVEKLMIKSALISDSLRQIVRHPLQSLFVAIVPAHVAQFRERISSHRFGQCGTF